MSGVGCLRVLTGCWILDRSHVGAAGVVALVAVSLARREMAVGRRDGIARAEGSSARAVRKMDVCMMKAEVCRGITMLMMGSSSE
jgi:hypothetical protein